MLTLSILPTPLAVARLASSSPIPPWATTAADFFSITKTPDELSIVCSEDLIPPDIKAERGWRGLKVEGPLDFSLTGILSSLTTPLAEAKISIFAISTFDTDYLLIKNENFPRALDVLRIFCKIRAE